MTLGSWLDSFTYENFTGDMDDPDFYLNHPDDGTKALAERARSPGVVQRSAEGLQDETGISSSSALATDPFDPRWGDVWSCSYELRQDIPNMSTEEADQRAFKQVFGS